MRMGEVGRGGGLRLLNDLIGRVLICRFVF
jgi:hypothetical protein